MPKETMQHLADLYVAMRARQYEQSTVRNDESTVSRFARWWDATRRSPKSLVPIDMERYLWGPGGLRDCLANGSSFNASLGRLKRFVQWLVRHGYGSSAVIDEMTPVKTARGEYVRLSLVQISDMIENCDDEWERWVLTLACYTLGRDSELKALRWRDFNTDTMLVAWYRKKTKQFDELPITAELASGLRRWKTAYQEVTGVEADPNFYTIPRRGRCRSSFEDGASYEAYYRPDEPRVSGLSKIVQGHVCGITGWNPADLKGQGVHIIRRSMARALYDRLVTAGHADAIRIVQAQLGHASEKTTEIYLGLSADRERRNELLAGSSILSVPRDNVVDLREVRRHG